ncbi:MAG TPA: nuclear transport factor 2 family protein [Luteimonas sp.]
MKRIGESLLLLFLALASSGAHCSEPGNAPSAELVELSTQWMDSMLRHDKARLEALMAPGFVLHTAHPDYPETSRERWLDNLFNHLRIDEWEQTNISAHTYGDVGVVTSAYRWSGSMYEQPFDAKGHCTDVWQLRDQQWQVVSRSCMEY